MAKLFLTEKITRLRREIKLTRKQFFTIVATNKSDFNTPVKWAVELEPFPHYIFTPDPNNLWRQMELLGVNHPLLRLILYLSDPPMKRLTAFYFSDQDYRESVHGGLKRAKETGIANSGSFTYQRIKDNFFTVIHRRILKANKMLGYFGSEKEMVEIAIAEGLIPKDVILKVSVNIKENISGKLNSEDYPKLFSKLVNKAIERSTTFKNFKIDVVKYALAQPNEIIIPSKEDVRKREKEINNQFKIAEFLAKVVKEGKLAEYLRQEGVEPIVSAGKIHGKAYPIYPVWRNISRLFAQKKFSFQASREIWDKMSTSYGILPNPD